MLTCPMRKQEWLWNKLHKPFHVLVLCGWFLASIAVFPELSSLVVLSCSGVAHLFTVARRFAFPLSTLPGAARRQASTPGEEEAAQEGHRGPQPEPHKITSIQLLVCMFLPKLCETDSMRAGWEPDVHRWGWAHHPALGHQSWQIPSWKYENLKNMKP